jgi:hypothetical protein
MRFVNVYYQTQRYGGPEEGGWWYDHNEPVSSKRFTSNRKCKKWWKKQVAFASNMNMCLPDYTSSRSRGQWVVFFEEHPAVRSKREYYC